MISKRKGATYVGKRSREPILVGRGTVRVRSDPGVAYLDARYCNLCYSIR